MSYFLLTEVALDQTLPTLQLNEQQQGIGILVRYAGRPIGFYLKYAAPGTIYPAEQLAELLWQECGWKVFKDNLHTELCPSTQPALPPRITVAICTKDRSELLQRCLQSLNRLVPTAASDGTSSAGLCEILVVDNAPSDSRTRDLVSEMPNVRYVMEPIPGLDFARNRALAEAQGDWLVYLDDDATVDPYWLRSMAEAIADNPDVSALTGAILPLELNTEAQVLFESRGGFQRGFNRIRYGQELPGNSLYPCGPGIFGAGCNMAFRRDMLLELGGFDEALDTGRPLPGGGDLDIFYRTIRAGKVLVYEPGMLIFHEHRRDLRGLKHQYYTWGLGFFAFLCKNYQQDPAMRAKMVGITWWYCKDHCRRLAKSLLRRSPMPFRMIFAEMWGGVVGLCGEYRRSQKRVKALRDAAS